MEECRGIQRIEESYIRGLPLIAGIKNFSNSELSREEVIKKLAACINSGQLRLSRAPSIEQLPDILEELGERLESVNLSNIEMTPELRSKIFDSLPVGLKEINLGKTGLTDSEIDKLARFPELSRLSLLFNSITDRAIEKLISLPLAKSLRTLSLGACTTMTDRGIELLTQLDELERLFLASLPHVTYVGISSLTTLPKLQSLTVAWCFTKFNYEFRSFSSPSLTSLSIIGAGFPLIQRGYCSTPFQNLRTIQFISCPNLTNYCIASLMNSSLEKMTIIACPKIDLMHINTFGLAKNLKRINLINCPIVDSSLKFLIRAPALQFLRITRWLNLTHEGIESVKQQRDRIKIEIL